MKTLRLGTRKSALAQAQAAWVAGQLREMSDELKVEIILITTSGDRISSSPAVSSRGSTGLMTQRRFSPKKSKKRC